MKCTPLRRMSAKRREQMTAYIMLRAILLRHRPYCEMIDCMKPSQEIHHKRGRSGRLLCDERFLMAVCNPCHSKIHENGRWARAMGLLLT